MKLKSPNLQKQDALFYTVLSGNIDIITSLLKLGFNVNKKDAIISL